MPVENNRLLLELEKFRRDINRGVINPEMPELSLEDLKPVLTMIAHTRASYLRELIDIARLCPESGPSPDQIRHLKHCRDTYEELVAAMNALETAIQRDYLDVRPSKG